MTTMGRKKTIVWPPHQPVYCYCAVLAALVCALLFTWERAHFGLKPLQRFYLTAYSRTAVGAMLAQHGDHRLLYIGTTSKETVLAQEDSVASGHTAEGTEQAIPLTLSLAAQAHGARYLYIGPSRSYADKTLHLWMQRAIYNGKSLGMLFLEPALESVAIFLLMLAFCVPADVERYKQMKYGRLLKGPELLTVKRFIAQTKGDGIGFKTSESKDLVRIPKGKEAQHYEIMGDTGAGKTSLIKQMLVQVRQRGESAIVHDPACEYIKQFWQPGDIVLNPFDARCPYWGPVEELADEAEADALSASLYQPVGDNINDKFFYETPAQIFAAMIKDETRPTPQQLATWMCNAEVIEQLVAGTEIAHFIDRKAGPQRTGVLSSLGLKAKSLRYLPTPEEAEGRTWTAREWSKERKGWIFLTSQPTHRAAIQPLHSLWIDLLVMRLLTEPTEEQRPVWFVIDELASLQKLPQLHTALTENRKSKNPVVIGFQGKAQLETIYGHNAEVMMSQPATKLVLRTTEPKAAEWVSKMIGSVEIERVRETKLDGSRHGKSFTLESKVEPLVLESEVSGLPDLHAIMKIGNTVTRFDFEYLQISGTAEGFVARKVAKPAPQAAQPPKLPEAAADDNHAAEPEDSESIEQVPVSYGTSAL